MSIEIGLVPTAYSALDQCFFFFLPHWPVSRKYILTDQYSNIQLTQYARTRTVVVMRGWLDSCASPNGHLLSIQRQYDSKIQSSTSNGCHIDVTCPLVFSSTSRYHLRVMSIAFRSCWWASEAKSKEKVSWYQYNFPKSISDKCCNGRLTVSLLSI